MTTVVTANAALLEHAGLLKRIQEILGVQRLRTDRDLVAVVERRLPSRAIDALRQSDWPTVRSILSSYLDGRSHTGAPDAKR